MAGCGPRRSERHDAGRIKAVEVRGSDYMGPRVSTATGHIARVAPAALQGKTVRVFGRPDQPHSFTDVRDMARALVRVAGEPTRVGPGLARADQPRQDPDRGAPATSPRPSAAPSAR